MVLLKHINLFFSTLQFRLIREGFWIIFGQINTVLSSFVLIRILTDYLSPADYGYLALGLTFVSLVNQVVMAGISQGFARFFLIAKNEGYSQNFILASLKILFKASLLIIIFGVLVALIFYIFKFSYWLKFILAITIYSTLSGWIQAINSVQNSARQRSLVAFHTGLESWLKTGLIFLFFTFQVNSDLVLVVSLYSLSLLIVFISQAYHFKKVVYTNNSINNIKTVDVLVNEIWLFSKPFSLWGGFTWLQLVSDRWALQKFATSEEVGMYAVLYQMGYAPVAMITGFVVTLILPMLYERAGNGSNKVGLDSAYIFNKKLTMASLCITLIGFIVLLFFHKNFLSFFVSNEYLVVSYLLPWIFLAGGIFSTAQIISLNQMVGLKTENLLRVKIATALIGILFSIIGASILGLEGVVVSLNLFSIFYLLWLVKVSNNSQKLE